MIHFMFLWDVKFSSVKKIAEERREMKCFHGCSDIGRAHFRK